MVGNSNKTSPMWAFAWKFNVCSILRIMFLLLKATNRPVLEEGHGASSWKNQLFLVMVPRLPLSFYILQTLVDKGGSYHWMISKKKKMKMVWSVKSKSQLQLMYSDQGCSNVVVNGWNLFVIWSSVQCGLSLPRYDGMSNL